jgi:hypothetical protein
MRRCDGKQVSANPNRRSECRAIGQLMASGDALISVHMGHALLERTANSSTELAALREERDALRAVQSHMDPLRDLSREDARYSCEAAKRTRAYFSNLATLGEPELLRRKMKELNLTVEQAAAQYRARSAAAR